MKYFLTEYEKHIVLYLIHSSAYLELSPKVLKNISGNVGIWKSNKFGFEMIQTWLIIEWSAIQVVIVWLMAWML